MFRIFGITLVFIFVLFVDGCFIKPHPPTVSMQSLSGSVYYSKHVKKMVSQALVLSKRRLNYRFGSSGPRHGGMDCSGTIHYLLYQVAHMNSPRSASDMYVWVQRRGRMHYVHTHYFGSSEFNALRPGDLLFWTGTYRTRHRPPITHVMLYLGKDGKGRPLMFGASEGTYHGRIVRGIGVFDFTLPDRYERAKFVAYGCIPSYTCRAYL